jgi:methyl-accepting chemotaxis protein
MQNINNASRRISDIVSVIDEIAFQTNLLALNAAVEAARVGEQGRGFAVVASEVRSLAGRSSTAAKEIKNLMRETMEKVESGTELVNQSGEQLTQIVSSVKKVAEFVSNISTSSQEQSAGIEQVNKALVQLEEITQQNAALVEETAAASQSVSQRATHLDRLVSRFKYDEKLVIDDDIDQPTAVSHTFQTPAKLRMVNGGTASDVVRE